jgi:hypothetical protein
MKRVQRPWWRGPVPIIGTVVVVVVAIVIFIVVANQSNSGDSALLGKPLPATIAHEVTNVSPSVITTVGAGKLPNGSPLPNPIRAVTSTLPPINGKPQVLFVGAEFCPYCAADRWSLVNSLARFGTFSNLSYMRSAVNDGDIATVTFRGSTYTSKYLSFVPVENEDRNRNQLQPLTTQQAQLFSTLGGNGYPFLDIGGRYANDAPNSYPGGYDQSVLTGLDWSQIAGALTNTKSSVTQGIIGNANIQTAAFCAVTHNQPASACNVPVIQQIEQKL